ncbi:hypothetical protein D915_009874 [Fasciola hepatica]|uniref:Uncharacterized protein n=1 Tax=Fasciola hepatica TaxID=6192 RepID=A0A4E0R0M3_FASHE|nr:hypothetical protein D915_009874 [Fasciola hepatica]
MYSGLGTIHYRTTSKVQSVQLMSSWREKQLISLQRRVILGERAKEMRAFARGQFLLTVGCHDSTLKDSTMNHQKIFTNLDVKVRYRGFFPTVVELITFLLGDFAHPSSEVCKSEHISLSAIHLLYAENEESSDPFHVDLSIYALWFPVKLSLARTKNTSTSRHGIAVAD